MFLIERCKYISLHIQDNNLLCMCVAIPRSPVHTHTHTYMERVVYLFTSIMVLFGEQFFILM